jgi:hypothetical protein
MTLRNEGLAKLDGTRAPFFPYAKEQYSREEMDYFINMLRQYFIQNDRFTGSLIDNVGGAYLSNPHGAFQDSTTQTAANTTTAYPITFNTTDFSNGVTMVSNSRFTVEYAGLYNLQFSVQLDNTTNNSVDVDIWFRKNGTDIPASNSRFGLAPRKGVGDPFHIIAGLNYFVDMQAEDYVQLIWRTSDVGATIKTYAAGTSPTRPSIPSVIATLSYVSRL